MRSSPFAHLGRLPSIPTFVACLAVALTPHPHPLLAAPDPSPLTLEVEISPAIPGAQDLADWIHRSSTAALSELPHPPASPGTIRVSVFGELYDYEVTITTLRAGSTSTSPDAAATTTTWPCECTNDELLAQIRTHVLTAAEGLDDSPSASPAPPSPSPLRPRPSLVIGRDGKIALGLLAGGQALTIAGTVLVAVGECGSAEVRAGIPTLAVGLTAIASGVAMFIIDRRKQPTPTRPHAAAFPLVTPRAAHLGIAVRF